jgi:hypothetical protein
MSKDRILSWGIGEVQAPASMGRVSGSSASYESVKGLVFQVSPEAQTRRAIAVCMRRGRTELDKDISSELMCRSRSLRESKLEWLLLRPLIVAEKIR